MTEKTNSTTRAGFVAIVGQTNAGKSTLMNAAMGQKIAIVTPKVQTTRVALRAVLTKDNCQLIFVDTPGFHQPKCMLDEQMVKIAHQAWKDADAVLMLIDAKNGVRDVDVELMEQISKSKKPAFLVVNKVDLISEKDQLLPLLQEVTDNGAFKDVYPISALKGTRGREKMLPKLLDDLRNVMPESPYLYDEETVTDIPIQQMAAEITREKAFMFLQQELPYGVAVQTVNMEDFDNGDIRIDQHIILEREAHRQMVIGRKGEMLKRIGMASRKELKTIMDRKVHLFLEVKVKKGWSENQGILKELGLWSR